MGPEDADLRVKCEQLFDRSFVDMGVKKELVSRRELREALDHRPIGVRRGKVKLTDPLVESLLKPLLDVGLECRRCASSPCLLKSDRV